MIPAPGFARTAGLIVIGFILGVSPCAEVAASQSTTPAASTQKKTAANDPANATFSGIYDEPVNLRDGRYEGEPFAEGGASRPTVQLERELQATGDLDGDGRDETVVLLTESSGGSGTNLYVAAVIRAAEGPKNISTRLVGDRVQVRSMEATGNGELRLSLVLAGPGEPACCPTLKVSRTYRLKDGELIESGSAEEGPVSIADLEKTTWNLTHLDVAEALPAGLEVTAVFAGDKVTGLAGCNRYFAGIEGSGPGDFSIGLPGATRMACAEATASVENRYLSALENVKGFRFAFGKLALPYSESETARTLLFAPARDR